MNINEYLEKINQIELSIKNLKELKGSNEYTDTRLTRINELIEENYKKLDYYKKIVDVYNYNMKNQKGNEIDIDKEEKNQLLNNFKEETNNIVELNLLDTSKVDSLLKDYSIMFTTYNEEVKILIDINSLLRKLDFETNLYNKLSSEEFKEWYEKDIPNKTKIEFTFKQYEEDINKLKSAKLKEKNNLISNKIDEYYVHLYYFLKIKNDIKIELTNMKNELENKISDYENNFNKLIKSLQDINPLENRDKNTYKDIAHALKTNSEQGYLLYVVSDYLSKISLSEKEINFIKKGLSLNQKEIYNSYDKKYEPKYELDIEKSKFIINYDNKFIEQDVINIWNPNSNLNMSINELKKYLKTTDGIKKISLTLKSDDELNNNLSKENDYNSFENIFGSEVKNNER